MSKPRDPLYWVWDQMRQRCGNPRHRQFKDYGGRGITVCAQWQKSFLAFKRDMGERPDGMSIERTNNNSGYSPQNCRWATRLEQNSNKRNCIYVVIDQGRRVTLNEYCRINGLKYRPIVKRVQDRKWPLQLALHIPVGSGRQHNAEILHLWDENQELREALRVVIETIDSDGLPHKNWHWFNRARKLSETPNTPKWAEAA